MLSQPASPLKMARSSRAESIFAKLDRPDRNRTARTSRHRFPPKRLPRAHKITLPEPRSEEQRRPLEGRLFLPCFFARENSSRSAKFLSRVQHFLNSPIF